VPHQKASAAGASERSRQQQAVPAKRQHTHAATPVSPEHALEPAAEQPLPPPKMLKILHNHIFATKLRDVFTQSPLVLVYQTVGSVDVADAAAKLQSQLDKQLPSAGLRVQMCRMRNSIAAGSGQPALQQMFQASNLLVGFGARPPSAAAAVAGEAAAAASTSGQSDSAAAAAEPLAARSHSLQELLGSLFGASSPSSSAAAPGGQQQQQQQQQLTHKALAKAFQLGSALPGDQPLVLLGAFYGRESIRLAHLKEWVGLDEGKVRRRLRWVTSASAVISWRREP
jgi:hypothetical protein